MNYNRAYSYKECIAVYKTVYQEFDGTGGYMSDSVVEKICKKINKRLFKDFKVLDKEDRRYQRELRKEEKQCIKKEKAYKKAEIKAKILKEKILSKRIKRFIKLRSQGKTPDYSGK